MLRSSALVAGEWMNSAAGGKTFDVTNPSTGESVANADNLATMLTMEMGKPYSEVQGESLYGRLLLNGSVRKQSVFRVIPFQVIRKTSELSFSNSPLEKLQPSHRGTLPIESRPQ